MIQPHGLDRAVLGLLKGLHVVEGYLLLEQPQFAGGRWWQSERIESFIYGVGVAGLLVAG